jgi:flavin reductase (DIM6/NTAB) family NADH-FMN oxidoreductase RutF
LIKTKVFFTLAFVLISLKLCAMKIDNESFKTILSKFATGVAVVTTCVDGENHGMTVNAFCSVSLSPRLILICVEKAAETHDTIARAENFAVNLLTDRQAAISERFADPALPQEKRFKNLRVMKSTSGSPLLAETMGYIDCKKYNAYEGGDHTIFLGEVIEIFVSPNNSPLLYFDRDYTNFQNGKLDF